MMSVRRQAVVRCAAVAAAMLIPRAAAAASLTLSANPRSVEVGEAVRLTVTLQGASSRVRPQVALPQGARAAYQGESTSFFRDGRRMTRSQIFTYQVSFAKAGAYMLGPATVRTDRGQLRSGSVKVAVREAGKGRDILVFAELKPARCYVGQPVVATFAYARARKTDGERLSVPFLKKIDGVRLSDPENLGQRWDESVRKTRRGLPGYQLVRFSRTISAVARTGRREIDGVPYEVWKVTRALLPQEPKPYDLGRASATAAVVVGYRQEPDPFGGLLFPRRRAVTRTLTATSEPLVLDVLRLPEEGRPPGFEGAVGSYELSASAHPRETKLGGDPITLTLTVSGEGNLETVGRPALAAEASFRIGAAEMRHEMRFEDEKLVGVKRFVVPLRPRSARVTEIPAAALVVFDPAAEKYVTLRTDPIPVRVTAPEGTGALETVAIPEEARAKLRKQEEARRDIEDIEIDVDISSSHRAWLHGPLGLILFVVLPLAAYGALALVARRRRELRENMTLARRLAAARTARSRLEELRSGAELPPGEFAQKLARAFQGYLADRLGRPAGELGPDEAETLLAGSDVPSDCAADAAAILKDAGAARFGGGGVDAEEWLCRVESCVDAIEKGARP